MTPNERIEAEAVEVEDALNRFRVIREPGKPLLPMYWQLVDHSNDRVLHSGPQMACRDLMHDFVAKAAILATLQSLLEPVGALTPDAGRLDFYDAKVKVRAMIQQAIKEME